LRKKVIHKKRTGSASTLSLVTRGLIHFKIGLLCHMNCMRKIHVYTSLKMWHISQVISDYIAWQRFRKKMKHVTKIITTVVAYDVQFVSEMHTICYKKIYFQKKL